MLSLAKTNFTHRVSIKNNIEVTMCYFLGLLFFLFPSQSLWITSTIATMSVRIFDSIFLITSSLIVILCFAIALSPAGKIKLGKSNDMPMFGFFSWISMLFVAGMGSGLIFWGVAEPVTHLSNPPYFAVENGRSAKDMALAITYFHWGLHTWCIYAIAGLAIAWFSYKRNKTMSISSSFTKNETNRFAFLEYLAVIAVIFGLAGTLANSIALIESGVKQIFHSDGNSFMLRLILLFFISIAFTMSSISGINKGIKNLSKFNAFFAIFMLTVVFAITNPVEIITRTLTSTWTYISQLYDLSFSIKEESRTWSQKWTIVYLLWWISWTPFVGVFIAKISYGRTIRQFLYCTILIPTIASIIWFSTFSTPVFESSMLPEITQVVNENYSHGLFDFFKYFQHGLFLSFCMIMLLITFVITSGDSAICVTSILTKNDSSSSKLQWSILIIIITLALIYRDNIELNKKVAVIGAIPFFFIITAQVLFTSCDIIKYLKYEAKSTNKAIN